MFNNNSSPFINNSRSFLIKNKLSFLISWRIFPMKRCLRNLSKLKLLPIFGHIKYPLVSGDIMPRFQTPSDPSRCFH